MLYTPPSLSSVPLTLSTWVVDGVTREAFIRPPVSGPVVRTLITGHGHGGNPQEHLSHFPDDPGTQFVAPQGLPSRDGKNTFVWPGSPPDWDMYPIAAPSDHHDLHFYRQIISRVQAAHPGVPMFHSGHSMGGMLGLEAMTFIGLLSGAWINSFGFPVDYSWRNTDHIPMVFAHGESGMDQLTQRLGRALDWPISADKIAADCGATWGFWSENGSDDGCTIESRIADGGKYKLSEIWYRNGLHQWHTNEAKLVLAWIKSLTTP